MAEIWERLPNESSKAYQAFCIYRDLGVERSLEKPEFLIYVCRDCHKKFHGG